MYCIVCLHRKMITFQHLKSVSSIDDVSEDEKGLFFYSCTLYITIKSLFLQFEYCNFLVIYLRIK